tara:strand:+ start:769 stop:972 length:204 start_codon:yes stop_codon:yes gene_type:complete
MEEVLFVVEYKVKGELFVKKFAYDSKYVDSIEGMLYVNSVDASELMINRDCLEYKVERPMRVDERFE